MTHLVYPGALHTRFHHALGAMYLMETAIETLRGKGQAISKEEEEAVIIAILLHDAGHGPFSHALEDSIVQNISHEDISSMLMTKLDAQFNGKLKLAIEIFDGTYHRKFLHQLVSSQLDMDRMDYLNRDSFFTGVSEGVISSHRIIKMLNVVDDQIVIEEKGIYSVEKFLIARRLMYWQVYLHKTVIAAEMLLAKILTRSRELGLAGEPVFATPVLDHFLREPVKRDAFLHEDHHLEKFASLDDTDIMAAVKVWSQHTDKTLSTLCRNLIGRHLYTVEISNEPPDEQFIITLKQKAIDIYDITMHEASYFVFKDVVRNDAYNSNDGNIRILMKNGAIKDITVASDNSNLDALAKTVKKHILCYDKALVNIA